MEITKREVIASISIIAIMIIVGILIGGKISEYEMDANEKYNKALKISDEELFKYAMDTNVGNAFVYGELKAIDPVTYPDIEGEYLALKKIKERYTEHTRTVTYTDSKGKTKTRTETYWTWDVVDTEKKNSTKVNFLGVDFNASQFHLPGTNYIKTIKESYYTRYKYYGYPSKSMATIFSYLSDGNIENGQVPIYENKSIEETIDYLESSGTLIIFWVGWILLIGVIVYGFYYLDNNWLNK